MAKVIQWYVDNTVDPNTDIEFSNYFPWNELGNRTPDDIVNELHCNTNKYDFGRYTFISDPKYHSWKEFDNETEIRFISTESHLYEERHINIFPIRFLANEDEIFRDPKLCPFANLPESTIKWLQEHKECSIVFHDPHEAKAITNELFVTIPALFVKRRHYNLQNRFVWLDSRAESSPLIRNSDYRLPKWLVFASSSHWLQFVGHTVERKELEIIKRKSKQVPLFHQGRFLMYAGRWRPARYYILNQLLGIIPKENFWLSAAYNSDVNGESDINNLLDYEEDQDHKRNVKGTYNAYDRLDMINLFNQMPINTFPTPIQEGHQHYQHVKYFWLPNPAHYSRSFIDISCETYNERSGRHYEDIFLTEKICKPLWAGRPFIMSANPRTYEQLSMLGFETFNKWWDESFDKESDIKTHSEILLNAIKYINNCSNDECKKIYQEMKPALSHNQQLIEYYTFDSPRFWITELKRLRLKKLI